VGRVILNLVRPPLLSSGTRAALEAGTLTEGNVAQSLAKTSLEPAAAPALIAGGDAHLERQRLQDGQRDILEDCGQPLVELPALTEGIDLGALFDLAERLRGLA
jgi:hypothetical protein